MIRPLRHLTLLLMSCMVLAKETPQHRVPPSHDLSYSLPTEHRGFFGNEPEKYYMYVDRHFEGVDSRPWQGGTYGFTRNAFRDGDGKVRYSRFHEGMDVAPLRRDAEDEPLDLVNAIAPGTVVYVNDNPHASSYGRYLVVAHRVPEGIIFSLYAHMKDITCKPGDKVNASTPLGGLGYTGKGINRRRAHLHLEVALMINYHYKLYAPPSNLHDRFNGLNLAGMNPADLLHRSKGGKKVSLSQYFSTLKEFYRVRVPYQEDFDLIRRYPFLYKPNNSIPKPASYEISFTDGGLPIAVYPSEVEATDYSVVQTTPVPTDQSNATAKRLQHSSKNAKLTASGQRYLELFLFQPPAVSQPSLLAP